MRNTPQLNIEGVAKNLKDQNKKEIKKADVISLIKDYKEILNKEAVDYLTSLVNLEINVLTDDSLNPTAKELLRKLNLYRYIVNYNLIGYSKKALSKIDKNIVLPGAYTDSDFTYAARYKDMVVFKLQLGTDLEIATLEFSKLIQDVEFRKKILELIKEKYEVESNKKDATINTPGNIQKSHSEFVNRKNDLKKLQALQRNLSGRKFDKEKLEVSSMSQYIFEALKEEYQFFEEDVFLGTKEDSYEKITKSIDEPVQIDYKNNELVGKKLVKQHPSALIYSKTVYY